MNIGEIIRENRKKINMTQEELKSNLIACFCDEESYGFLKEDKRYHELLKGYTGKKNEM